MPAEAPTISPADSTRLAALFEHSRSPFELAEAAAAPLHEILAWLARPDIQEHIDRISRLEADAHRAAAIGHLRRVAEKTDNLVEKRRAACAILRALNPCRQPPFRPRPATPPVPPNLREVPSSQPASRAAPPEPLAPFPTSAIHPPVAPDPRPANPAPAATAAHQRTSPPLNTSFETLNIPSTARGPRSPVIAAIVARTGRAPQTTGPP